MVKKDRTDTRRRKVVRRFGAEGIDGLLVTDRLNVFYLTGFRGDDSAALLTADSATLLTDGHYAEEAAQALRGVGLVVRKKGMMSAAARTARDLGVRRLGVEADAVTLAQGESLREEAGDIEVAPVRGLVEALRIIKDAGEVKLIREAIRLAQDAFKRTLAEIGPGWTELAAARKLNRHMEDLGASGPAFPTIVASGPRSSLPHAVPTNRVIRSGEPVLFDWGARHRMVHSDLTRVVFWDRIPTTFERLYATVLDAQQRAIAHVRTGRAAGAIDERARAHLKAHRRGKYFRHAF